MPNARGGDWARRLWSAGWRHPRTVLLAGSAAVVFAGVAAAGPLIARRVVDDAVAGSTGSLLPLLIALVAVAGIRFGTSYVSRYAADRLGADVQHDLRTAGFAALQRLDGTGQDRLRAGHVMSRMTTDLQLVHGLVSALPLTLGTAVLGIAAFGAMLVLSPLLAVLAMAVLASISVVTACSGSALTDASRSAQRRAEEMAQHVDEAVAGVQVVKGFAQEEREARRFAERARALLLERLRVARISAKPASLLVVLPGLGQVGLLAAGGWLAMEGRLSLGTFLAFFSYLGALAGPVGTLSSTVLTARLGRVAAERVFELLDTQSSIVDAADARDVPAGPLSVRLDNVRFGYLPADPVLDGVSVAVRPGETLALVGPPGSGKSTVMQLLARFYDVHDGSVRLGAPGAEIDVRDLKQRSLRSAVGVAFEETFLFDDTVRANIAYARPDATGAEVEAAARAASAHDFIVALPQGYDTPVGERGLRLSGGQRQRIALSRVLLADPRVLLLDDVTSAVDAGTEAAIQGALRRLVRERTTLLVAHRRSTLNLADRIVVLDQGKVVDAGTRQELESRCPLFVSLFAEEAETPASDLRKAADPQQAKETGEPDARPLLDPRLDGSATGGYRVAAFVRPVRGLLVVAVALLGLHTLAGLALPSLIRHALDNGVTPGAPAVLAMATAAGMALVLAQGWAVAGQTVTGARAVETVLHRLRTSAFGKLQRLGLDYYEREPAGRILTRMTTDTGSLGQFMTSALSGVIVSAPTVIGVVVILWLTDVRLALVATVALPLVAMTTGWFRRSSARAHTDAREKAGTVDAGLRESLSGLRVSQASNREAELTARLSSHSDAYRYSRLKGRRQLATWLSAMTLIVDLTQALVLGFGAYRVAAGDLTPGVLLAFVLYLARLGSPIQQLSNVLDGYQQARVAWRRLGELFGAAEPEPDPACPVRIRGRLRGAVELAEVSYQYAGSARPALDRVSLRIEPGETVALVGSTGAGKSTLVKLLARFYAPTAGTVLVDGVDLRSYELRAYRRRLAVVPQEAQLFTGDIASNIGYPRPDAGPAEIEAAARRVGAWPGIAALPGGLRQPVGQRGQGLSAGQQQLVALARAELADPDLLLLDEATAALDPGTERAVLAARDRLSRRRTTVVVAHRLVTAARADRVVVLEQGRVVETGTHGQLLAAGGRYAQLWSAGSMDAA